MTFSALAGPTWSLQIRGELFSDKYANFQLLKCGCYAELSVRSPLAEQESVTMEELKRQACILISSREQQNTEEDYYKNTLGLEDVFYLRKIWRRAV